MHLSASRTFVNFYRVQSPQHTTFVGFKIQEHGSPCLSAIIFLLVPRDNAPTTCRLGYLRSKVQPCARFEVLGTCGSDTRGTAVNITVKSPSHFTRTLCRRTVAQPARVECHAESNFAVARASCGVAGPGKQGRGSYTCTTAAHEAGRRKAWLPWPAWGGGRC